MSWHFLQGQAEASWEANSLDGAPSALLKLMPTPAPSCSPGSGTDCCQPSPSGMTSAPSTGARGAGMSMSSVGASHVKTSAPPAEAQASMANAPVSGWKWRESFAKYDPSSRTWRTRQCSLLGGLTAYSETWPRWGSMRDGECSELTTLAHLTSGSAFGLWPTPRRTDADRGGRGDLIQAVRGNSNSHFKMWPTPDAHCWKSGPRGNGTGGGEMLSNTIAQRWPTPHGFSKDGKSNGPSGNELGRAVNQRPYPTPLARDAHNRSGQAKRYLEQGRVNLQDRNAADGIRGSLNPTWVEWLMGWPLGWTDCDASETARFRSWLQQHGAY